MKYYLKYKIAMRDHELQSLIQYLEREYYSPAEKICERIVDYVVEIHGGDEDQTASLYTSLCKRLTDEVRYYLRLRRSFLQPYISKKTVALNAGAYTKRQLEEAGLHVKDTLTQLKAVLPPIKHDVLPPDWDTALHQEVKKLDERLREMFYLEQTELAKKTERAGITA